MYLAITASGWSINAPRGQTQPMVNERRPYLYCDVVELK